MTQKQMIEQKQELKPAQSHEPEEAYTAFADVYDSFMREIPYEEWAQYVISLLKERGIDDGLVLELGCGTGTFTELLAGAGYDMIGVDNSPEMLDAAFEKKAESGSDILYLLQDMREFELYGTVRAVVSVCDSMNYCLKEEDLFQVFSLANNYLDPGGTLIFDLKTEAYYKNLGDRVFADHTEEGSLIWENTYYEEEQLNEYVLTMYLRAEDDLYERCEETHLQRAYSLEKIRELIEKAGLQFEAAYEAFSKEAPKKDSGRIYVIARECTKHKENEI